MHATCPAYRILGWFYLANNIRWAVKIIKLLLGAFSSLLGHFCHVSEMVKLNNKLTVVSLKACTSFSFCLGYTLPRSKLHCGTWASTGCFANSLVHISVDRRELGQWDNSRRGVSNPGLWAGSASRTMQRCVIAGLDQQIWVQCCRVCLWFRFLVNEVSERNHEKVEPSLHTRMAIMHLHTLRNRGFRFILTVKQTSAEYFC